MKIVVCVRVGADGEPNPFDASAYEVALATTGAEVILLSMGAEKTADTLEKMTRLGASRAILLCDRAFAGSDTLATAYALSCAIKKLAPDRIICGRKTIIGDTGQVPPMLAELLGYDFISNVLSADEKSAVTRDGTREIKNHSILAVEKQAVLRLPSLFSRTVTPEIMTADDIGAEKERCGLGVSPTRVLSTSENTSGKRKCRFIEPSELSAAVSEALRRRREKEMPKIGTEKLARVWSFGEAPLEYAKSVCENPEILPFMPTREALTLLEARIKTECPDALLFGNDEASREVAARLAAKLGLGLCADCTAITAEGGRTVMYRPALSGSLIAKIASNTVPALATVRSASEENSPIIVAAGYGVRSRLEKVRRFAENMGADFAVSRKLTDGGYAPYREQVGLTGKTVSPAVYIAVGISGAVHHIVGMDRSGTVIAINPDKNAPIFDYADIGICCNFEDLEDK